ncbi:unnamed protein product [Dicrocoelium dendriticum]|nr:unnamed protein product [Dicrocoelium dendriticum]
MRDLSDWIEFFASAGVPANVRKTYAQIFVDHRITDAVVADLDKDHLKDMGIVVVGDVIAILKRCKKVGHEDPSTVVPTVTSTTPRLEKQLDSSSPFNSTPLATPPASSHRRRMNPEIEGKYVVKQPVGTTAKTQHILAAMKQRATTTSKFKAVQAAPEKNATDTEKLTSSTTFGDSDVDDSDGYRVILSRKQKATAPTLPSVFDRLGGVCSASLSSPHNSAGIADRLIRRNLSPPSSTNSRPLVSTPGVEEHPRRASTLTAHRIGFTAKRTPSSGTASALAVSKVAQKRQGSDSVFTRLSEHIHPSAKLSDIGHATQHSTESLSYAGILKRQRKQPLQTFEEASVFRPMPITYSEGVLSGTPSTISPQKFSRTVPVKNRLGKPEWFFVYVHIL